MKKPVYRCLTNPTNFVGAGRFVEAKFEWVECSVCDGKGKRKLTDWISKVGFSGICIYCQGAGKISKRVKK